MKSKTTRQGKWEVLGMLSVCLMLLAACEKEIKVNLPDVEPELVVEAYVNNRFPTLNYVYVSQTIDYFNPKLDLLGVSGADVYISEGDIYGADTVFDGSKRYKLLESPFPGLFAGVYFSPELFPRAGKAYKLEVYYQGKSVTGMTQIPSPVRMIDDETRFEGEEDGKRKGYLTVKFVDPEEPAYYRMAFNVGRDSTLLGFGGVDRIRNFDDEIRNGQELSFDRFQSFFEGDTVDVYLCRLGVKEYRFWQSFASARNNEGPFATPVQLKSTLNGAIGCFTGFNIDYRRTYIKEKVE